MVNKRSPGYSVFEKQVVNVERWKGKLDVIHLLLPAKPTILNQTHGENYDGRNGF